MKTKLPNYGIMLIINKSGEPYARYYDPENGLPSLGEVLIDACEYFAIRGYSIKETNLSDVELYEAIKKLVKKNDCGEFYILPDGN